MTTVATINNRRVSLSIYEKAKLLSVYEVPGQSGYTVSSGSDAHKAYHVSADGRHCNCDSRVLCSHRVAAETFRRKQPATPRYEAQRQWSLADTYNAAWYPKTSL